ncbi:MAG TPA: hypothetical protein VF622_06015 [Segetibacter sp.]
MKHTRILLLFIGSIAFVQTLSAQKCYIPEPMSSAQINRVKGTWKGVYTYEGKEHPVTVKLYTSENITTQVDAPPLQGKETGEQIRFCGGGEFHLKKVLGDMSYEFQGTPKDGKIEGMFTMRRNDARVGSNGRFRWEKVK